MQVEDDTSPSRKGRKANVRVRPAPAVGPELGVGLASELRRRTFKPGSTKGRARMEVTFFSSLGLLRWNPDAEPYLNFEGTSGSG